MVYNREVKSLCWRERSSDIWDLISIYYQEFSPPASMHFILNRRNFLRVKAWPNACNIQMQQFNETSCKIFARNVLHTFGHLVATCEMLDGVGSSLKMVTFLLQHFRMLQDVAHIFPAPLQHLIAQSYDVTKCCMHSTEPWQANRGKREGVISLFKLFSSRVTRISCRLALASVRLKNAKILHLFCHCR